MKIFKCSVCSEDFPSRNQLFKHLNESGHGASAAGNENKCTNASNNNRTQECGDDSNTNTNTTQLSKGNDAYYEYYLLQNIFNNTNNNNTNTNTNSNDEVENDNEQKWKDVYHKLRTPLPVSYRIHESSPISDFSAQLLTLMENNAVETTERKSGIDNNNNNNNNSSDGKSSEKKTSAYQLQQWTFNDSKEHADDDDSDSIPKLRMTITPQFHRKNRSSSSKTNQDDENSDIYSPILHALQELGAVHRQELVSAIPPLVLWAAGSKTKGGDGNTDNDAGADADAAVIADLCAAPGSKSLQLLDMLYTSANNNNEKNIPSGLLVVNDSDRNRIITLCQRSRHVPRAPMLAINMDARYFPGIRRRCNQKNKVVEDEGAATATTNTTTTTTSMNVREKAGYKQKYDKVLCDVPCSGDGTVRKNKQVWNTWSIAHAMSLHRLQRKILRRGMELLRPGGIVVYSTCSLNPLEDEAVVASVIGDVGGVSAMEIIPLPEWLVKKCGALNGLTTWQVPNPKFGTKKNDVRDVYQDFEGVPMEHQGGGEKGKTKKKKGGMINPSMFPPDGDSEIARQLRNCGRFVPSEGLDSGGFFVACIRRLQVGELGAKDKASQEMAEEEKAAIAENGKDELEKAEDPKPPAKLEEPEPPVEEAEDPKPPAEGISESNNDPPTKPDQCLREGDWICTMCKEINFGQRGRSRCFGCKARKPRPEKKDKEEKAQPPLLVQPQQSSPVLESFFDFFGIATGPECTLPLQNIRIIRRVKETVIVVVSDALSKLAISESWSPVREVGITLATFPNATDEEQAPQKPEFRLLDEGLPILTHSATRRHFKLQPILFQNALAQSVQHIMRSSSTAEVERVKATLDRSLVVDSLCEKDMWYESLQDSLASMWALCKASPGFFIISCECKIPESEGSNGRFSFCGYVDAQGSVELKTSLRVAGAMLVILHKYSEVVSYPSSSSDLPLTKRRRM